MYDYVEGGEIWAWVNSIVTSGTTALGKKAASLITLDGDMSEIARTNYYGVFPVKYEQFTGFGQDIQTKERIILNYDIAEDTY